MIAGDDPQLKDDVIVVCAHYDHVGYGNRSNSYGPIGKIHPGADDNASGTSALLELAKAFTFLPGPPKRSILVAAFDGEEKGLLGSTYWVSHPTLPPAKVVACIDLDMIGRLRDDRLYVYGIRTGCGWRRLLSRQNDDLALQLDFPWEFKPDADYYPFYEKGIPVLLLHTGLHENYHRPSDTADLIRGEGMSRIVRLLFGTVYELAESDGKIPYRNSAKWRVAADGKVHRFANCRAGQSLGRNLGCQTGGRRRRKFDRRGPQFARRKGGSETGRPHPQLRGPGNPCRR